MLSICIPIYNFDIRPLIAELCNQVKKCAVNIEIICIDDCSTDIYKENNRVLGTYGVQYLELPQNIGRARIRNLFLQYAQYEYLLFIDCDVVITKNTFLETYIDIIKDRKNDVICGGHTYSSSKQARTARLRQSYGIKAECRDANTRNIDPYSSFISVNFMVSKALLSKVQFDERIVGYGHEDTLFGFRLNESKASILHINNEILKEDSESNQVFLHKTQQAVKSLLFVWNLTENSREFALHVSLLRFYVLHRKSITLQIILPILVRFQFIMEFILKQGLSTSLALFNAYKLSLLVTEINKSKQL